MCLFAGFCRRSNQRLNIPPGDFALGLQFVRFFIALPHQEDVHRAKVALAVAAKIILRDIVHVCDGLIHGLGKYFVDRIHNAAAGTVIVHEEDAPLNSIRFVRIAPALMLKQIWFRVTESVDGLLDIADHEKLMPRAGQ